MSINGDIGARHLIGSYAEAVVEVPVAGEAALTDVDTLSLSPPSRPKSNAPEIRIVARQPRLTA